MCAMRASAGEESCLNGKAILAALAPSSPFQGVTRKDWLAVLDLMAEQTYLRVVKNQCGGLPGPAAPSRSKLDRFVGSLTPRLPLGKGS
jgi:hypothetical protein